MSKVAALRVELGQARALVKSLREQIAMELTVGKEMKAMAKQAKANALAEKRALAIVRAQARLEKLLAKQAAPVGTKAKKAAKRPSKAVVLKGQEAANAVTA